jgi:hypothetical protein
VAVVAELRVQGPAANDVLPELMLGRFGADIAPPRTIFLSRFAEISSGSGEAGIGETKYGVGCSTVAPAA